MTVITLLTDFGLSDGYVGVMKGVIYGIAPQAHIADISHDIPPQNVLNGALALKRVAPFFPDGTIHVGVVDPGVGTARRPIAGQVGAHYFVMPDNGLATTLFQWARENGETVRVVNLDKPEYWLPEISNVFHGRDIFAPCGAHLAAGVPLEQLGTPIEDYIFLDIPQPQRIPEGGWRAPVIHCDHFGNLAVNLHRGQLEGRRDVVIRVGEETIEGLVDTFGQRPEGALAALFDSAGMLSIAVVNGNASDRLGLNQGDWVEVHIP